LEIFKKPHTLKTLLLLFIGFATCFGYYGLWMWLPELYHKMSINGGSPCSSGIISNTTSNQTVNCVLDTNIYRSTFISAMSNLPGNLFTIIFIDKMGRNLVTCNFLF
jgi:VNT family MFS transporter (synaptic vesicle glycoprotein 2)